MLKYKPDRQDFRNLIVLLNTFWHFFIMDVPAGTLSKVSYDSLALGFRRRMYAKKKDQTEIYQFDPFFCYHEICCANFMSEIAMFLFFQ